MALGLHFCSSSDIYSDDIHFDDFLYHTIQPLKPFLSAVSSKFLPMKTSLLILFSSGPHAFPGQPSKMECTPWRKQVKKGYFYRCRKYSSKDLETPDEIKSNKNLKNVTRIRIIYRQNPFHPVQVVPLFFNYSFKPIINLVCEKTEEGKLQLPT